jgi:hypothetical protein
MTPRKARKDVKMIKGAGDMRSLLHHHLNSLQIYCRLKRIMPSWLARKFVLDREKTASTNGSFLSRSLFLPSGIFVNPLFYFVILCPGKGKD